MRIETERSLPQQIYHYPNSLTNYGFRHGKPQFLSFRSRFHHADTLMDLYQQQVEEENDYEDDEDMVDLGFEKAEPESISDISREFKPFSSSYIITKDIDKFLPGIRNQRKLSRKQRKLNRLRLVGN